MLAAANLIIILFGLPIALTGIGELGTPGGSGWWLLFSIFTGLSAVLLWLVSGHSRTYWRLWLLFSLILFFAVAIKLVSYLLAGDILGLVAGLFIGILPLGFLFMVIVASFVLLTTRIAAFDMKATVALEETRRLFHHKRDVGTGGLPLAGRAIYLAGLAGIASFPVALILSSAGKLGIFSGMGAVDYLVGGLFGLPLFGVMLVFGRRLMQPAAHAKATGAEDLPILLLRAFADDERQIERKADLSIILFFGYKNKIRLEEAIAEELWQIGPFYGVGRPGEVLPQLGASKAYFSDKQWQDGVVKWIGSSQLIVMIAGKSDWLKWELDQVIERGALDRLMILFSPEEDSKDTGRWARTIRWLDRSPYGAALKGVDPKKVRALYFKPGGRVGAIVSNGNDQADYELAIRLAAYDMLGRKDRSQDG